MNAGTSDVIVTHYGSRSSLRTFTLSGIKDAAEQIPGEVDYRKAGYKEII